MKLIVGLGNPGDRYRDTKHNIGFITLDELAFQKGMVFNKSKFNSVYAEGRIGTEKIILVKPQTFMNNSGEAVRPWLDYFDIKDENLLVIYDDLDMEPGRVRLRTQGGSGGHNGIKSLIQHLGTKKFNRIKIGIGRPFPSQSVVSHVLSGFSKENHEETLEAINRSVEAIEYWTEGHTFEDTMSKFN